MTSTAEPRDCGDVGVRVAVVTNGSNCAVAGGGSGAWACTEMDPARTIRARRDEPARRDDERTFMGFCYGCEARAEPRAVTGLGLPLSLFIFAMKFRDDARRGGIER
jgi:hypothetical protein